jgi:hypothetical protein
MSPDLPNREELQTLIEAAINGQLTAEQLELLERVVLTDPESRRFYAQYLSQHAALCLSDSTRIPIPEPLNPIFESTPLQEDLQTPLPIARPESVESRFRKRRSFGWGITAGVAASFLLVLGWIWIDRSPNTLATLVEAKSCKWESGTLPTEVGSLLGPGRLRLAEGLARIDFANGAQVVLEAPADFELISPTKGRLHSGQVFVKVPPEAIGFVIDTPTTTLIDYGTEFGVKAEDGKTTDVQVFTGRVDGTHRESGQIKVMTTGAKYRFTDQQIKSFNGNVETIGNVLESQQPKLPENSQVVQITTAFGRGRDAFVQPIVPPPDRRSNTLLLVKCTNSKWFDWNRKAYMAFDLSSIQGQRIINAEFSITYTPSGMGFASKVPDATFVLYGLTEESLDHWDAKTISWKNAPANTNDGITLQSTKATRLGTFIVEQGTQTGIRTINSPALMDFLRRDTNRIITLILVRETLGIDSGDLVHGFANRNHPTLSPPKLRLTVQKP